MSMDGNGFLRLSHSLWLAGQTAPAGRALDQFDLDLPPATGPGEGLSAATLQALATLYLQSQLEQVGIIPAAEALADARGSLSLPTEQLAEQLERFAQQARNWYERRSRDQLFARVFGTGAGATPEAGAVVNREFEQRFAVLCAAIYRYAIDRVPGRAAQPADDAAVRQAAGDVLANLGLRQYGNTTFATRRIQEELQAAVALLKDPAVQSMFNASGFWPTLERILAPNVPDIARLVERGQAGQHLLSWLAGVMPGLGAAAGLPLSPQVVQWATVWLEASGVGAGAGAPARSVA